MTCHTLVLTDSLQKLLSEKQLRCIHTACEQTGYKVVSCCIQSHVFTAHDLVLGTQECLLVLLKNQASFPIKNFLVWGEIKEGAHLKEFEQRARDIRVILGEMPTPLFEIVFTHTLNFYKKSPNLPSIYTTLQQRNHQSFSSTLSRSNDRNLMQSEVLQFFERQIEKYKEDLIAGAQVYAKNFASILDEFLMNAIWDANPKYTTHDRAQHIELVGQEQVQVECLNDGINFALSVSDSFGTFGAKAIEKYVGYALGMHEEKVIAEAGTGAGLGLFMVLQKIGVVIFEIEKGKCTRAIAIARGDQAFRDMQKKPRALLFFEQ